MAVASELYSTGAEYVEEQCVANDEGDDDTIAIFEFGNPERQIIADTYASLEDMR